MREKIKKWIKFLDTYKFIILSILLVVVAFFVRRDLMVTTHFWLSLFILNEMCETISTRKEIRQLVTEYGTGEVGRGPITFLVIRVVSSALLAGGIYLVAYFVRNSLELFGMSEIEFTDMGKYTIYLFVGNLFVNLFIRWVYQIQPQKYVKKLSDF